LPANILCLLGAPRRKGNAELLLDKAMAGAKNQGAEIAKVRVADLKLAPCLACGGCDRTGECVVHDAMQEMYPQLLAAAGIIVSTPIFFMGLPAQLKALIDRCQALWVRKYHLGYVSPKQRKGLLMAVGATKFPYTFDAAKLEVKAFFHCLEVDYSAELLFPGIENHADIADHPEALAAAFRAGEELARSLGT
jgi:multimeric flavodoxin WrbA